MPRPRKGEEAGERPLSKRGPSTKVLSNLKAKRSVGEEIAVEAVRRVGEGTAANQKRLARHRSELTDFGHDIAAACESARAVKVWPKIQSRVMTLAKGKASELTKDERLVFVDGLGRVGVGRVVATRAGRAGKVDLLVLRRLYKKTVERCKSDYVAVPVDRVVNRK